MNIKAGTAFSLKLPVVNLTGSIKVSGTVYALLQKADSDAVWSTSNGGEWKTRATASLPTATLVTSGEGWAYDVPAGVSAGLTSGALIFAVFTDNTTPASITALSPTVEIVVGPFGLYEVRQ